MVKKLLKLAPGFLQMNGQVTTILSVSSTINWDSLSSTLFHPKLPQRWSYSYKIILNTLVKGATQTKYLIIGLLVKQLLHFDYSEPRQDILLDFAALFNHHIIYDTSCFPLKGPRAPWRRGWWQIWNILSQQGGRKVNKDCENHFKRTSG